MAATETKTWFTKTIAREAVEALSLELIEAGEIDQEIADKFNELFKGKKGAGGVTTIKVDGVIVGKKCSYLQKYLPISEFGTIGTDDKGETKYAYQSKEGAKLSRAAKTAFDTAIKEADLALEETEDIKAWKQAKLDAKTALEAPVVSEDGYATADEFEASL